MQSTPQARGVAVIDRDVPGAPSSQQDPRQGMGNKGVCSSCWWETHSMKHGWRCLRHTRIRQAPRNIQE